MGTAERRSLVLKLLCRRRYETITNLAEEFGVSERTIRRDIEVLSLSEPIYTQPGRYGGGVYVIDGYYIDRMYFQDSQVKLLKKILYHAETETSVFLSPDETKVLRKMISDYTKPSAKKK